MTARAVAGYFRQVTPRPPPRDLRASDADRERIVALLAEAAGDGRLTLAEHADRVSKAYQAKTLGELARLTRSACSARVSRPSPAASASSVTTRSRSASEARRSRGGGRGVI